MLAVRRSRILPPGPAAGARERAGPDRASSDRERSPGKQRVTSSMATAAIIFGIAYLLIASGRIPHVLIAVLGAMAMVLLGVLTEHEALSYVDLEVLLLLAGMMSLAEVASRTGAFDWAAIRCAQLAGGNGFRTLLLMSALTAAASAFLDNVTVVCSPCRSRLDLPDARCRSGPVPAGADLRLQHRRRVHRRRGPAQHHHFGGGRDRVRRVHAQRRAGEHPLDGRPLRGPLRRVPQEGHDDRRQP